MAIQVVCTCGKEFQVKDEFAGKKGKCKACGNLFAVPIFSSKNEDNPIIDLAMRKPVEVEASPSEVENEPKSSREYLIWMGLASGLVALVVGLIGMLNKHQRNTANSEVTRILGEAKEAATQNKWDEAISQVQEALMVKNATDLKEAEELAKVFGATKAKYVADSLLILAEKAIRQGNTAEASRLLQEYQLNPFGTRKSDAGQIAAELELATSDSVALNILSQLSDEEFQSFAKSGKLSKVESINNLDLRSIATGMFRTNLDKASSQRVLLRERQRDAEKLAEIQKARDVENEARAKVERIIKGEEDGEIVSYYLDGTIKEKGSVKGGKKDGLWIEHINLYFDESKATHKDGEADKENNLSVGRYIDGHRNGLWVSTKSRLLTYTTEYEDGIIEGVLISYKNNGQPENISERRSGKSEGYSWSFPTNQDSDKEEEKFGAHILYAYNRQVSFNFGPPPPFVRARLEAAVERHGEQMKTLLGR